LNQRLKATNIGSEGVKGFIPNRIKSAVSLFAAVNKHRFIENRIAIVGQVLIISEGFYMGYNVQCLTNCGYLVIREPQTVVIFYFKIEIKIFNVKNFVVRIAEAQSKKSSCCVMSSPPFAKPHLLCVHAIYYYLVLYKPFHIF
jgi:hypothetical protein